LYLRALLQQGKWDMAMGYLSSMERTSDESTRPNEHTLNILLQYQVIGSLWRDGGALIIDWAWVILTSCAPDDTTNICVRRLEFLLRRPSRSILSWPSVNSSKPIGEPRVMKGNLDSVPLVGVFKCLSSVVLSWIESSLMRTHRAFAEMGEHHTRASCATNTRSSVSISPERKFVYTPRGWTPQQCISKDYIPNWSIFNLYLNQCRFHIHNWNLMPPINPN